MRFVRAIPEDTPVARLAELDAAFDLTGTGNSEVLFAWLLQAIRHDYEPAYGRLEAFLSGMGRLKFLRPLYQELAGTEAGKAHALFRDEKIWSRYHPFSVSGIEGVLGPPD